MSNPEEENMEVEAAQEQAADDLLAATSVPLVFNPEDYGPIDIPDAVQSVATYEPDGPRLMITKIVNENFKSYAGVKTLGPFHRNFTAIIGPNGSGKSNVIDSMLFVFGYRANKIRSKKISVLIHNSEKHRDINSCTVAVHFQKIIDTGTGDDEYTVVPDSELVVSRVAYRDNSSSYYLNGKKAAYKEVAQVLRRSGIDLDHNRFLILQGEVEQIALMKPKALTEHEDGMLEFLEDIIGSNRFKNPIDLLSKRVETLTDLRLEKLNRVKAVEKEMESLEGPRNVAIEYLNTENAISTLNNKLCQIYLMECTQHEAKAQMEREKVVEEKNAHEQKFKEMIEKKREKLKEFEQVKKEYKKLVKGCEESKEKFSEMESQDAKNQEDLKLNKAKAKKLEKAIEVETLKIEELKVVPEQAETACADLKKKLENLERAKTKEEENEKIIMDSLKDETKDLQAEKDVKEAKLVQEQGELNDKKSKLQVAESELEMYTAKEQAETNKLENLKRKLKETSTALAKRNEDIGKVEKELPRLEELLTKEKAQLKETLNAEKQCEEKRSNVRGKVEEVKSSMASSKSKNRVLESLMGEKKKGTLPGIFGRLGDLGAIDQQYDVAVSTACGSLDHIVVDTIDTGKKCIEYLKKYNIGQANFILLDKMEVWRAETQKRMTTPENVPRLFDLIRVQDEKVKTAFYFALRNTLVSKDIDQATRIAYGRTRYRVVTLKGEIIEMSGAMSGGGNTVCKGKMGSSVVSDVDPKEIMNMENMLEKLNKEWENLQHTKVKLEDSINQNEKDTTTLRHNLKKFKVEVQGLETQMKSLKSNIIDQELVLQSVVPDPEKLSALKSHVQECRKDYEKVSATASELEEEVRVLHNQILDIGGAKLSACQSRLKTINNDIDKTTGQITKNNVGVKTAGRNLKRAEEKLVSLKEEVEETKQLIESLKEKEKETEGVAKHLLELYERAQGDVKEREEQMGELNQALQTWETQETAFEKENVEIRHKLEKYDCVLKENSAKIKHWRKELSSLSISPIPGQEKEEGQEEKLPTHTEEELQTFSKQDIQYEITPLEEKLAQMKPNMAAIAEYRKKEETYLKRVGELDQITDFRNQQRNYHDTLRKQRLEEFMNGFQVITNKLKEMYQMITLGGDAELELVDSLDPFSEGIVFSVRPPKKSWKNISNLSGGEKTLSSLALVFALHHYKPTPLYVMDEIDAALDFKNVSIVANYIKERTKNAQFIIISLRNNMFELADRLVGIYKTHDSTKSVTLNPWKLSEDFTRNIQEIHNIEIATE